MDGQEHTDTAKYLLWLDLATLIVLTYWKLKVKDQTLRAKIPLILTSSSIHSAGLLAAPKIYQLHQAAKNANKNGYDLSDQIYIEIRWTIEQITEKVMIEINRLSNSSISVQDKEVILKQSLQQGKLEQALQYAKRIVLEKQNIIESSLPKENIGWFQWIYNGITWSFTSDAYYAGYILLAVTVCGAAVYYLYQPGTSIPTTSSEEVKELIKKINDVDDKTAFLEADIALQLGQIRTLEEKYSKIRTLKNQIDTKTIDINSIINDPEQIKKLTEAVLKGEMMQNKLKSQQETLLSMVSREQLLAEMIQKIINKKYLKYEEAEKALTILNQAFGL